MCQGCVHPAESSTPRGDADGPRSPHPVDGEPPRTLGERVLEPGLASVPGHGVSRTPGWAVWQRQCRLGQNVALCFLFLISVL